MIDIGHVAVGARDLRARPHEGAVIGNPFPHGFGIGHAARHYVALGINQHHHILLRQLQPGQPRPQRLSGNREVQRAFKAPVAQQRPAD